MGPSRCFRWSVKAPGAEYPQRALTARLKSRLARDANVLPNCQVFSSWHHHSVFAPAVLKGILPCEAHWRPSSRPPSAIYVKPPPLTSRYAVTILTSTTLGESMAKTVAERQAAYRARRDTAGVDGNGQRRVSMWLSTGAALAMARLASRYGVTQRELVEKMLLAEDERVLGTLSIDNPEWEMYFARRPVAIKT